MPEPVSATCIRTCCPAWVTRRDTLPPAGVWRSALLRRLRKTWARRSASPSTGGASASVDSSSRTPEVSATGVNCAAAARQVVHVKGQLLQAELACIGEREIVQIVDKAGEKPRLVVQVRHLRHLQRVDAVEERLQVALNDGQGRTQLMRDVGDKVPPQGFGIGQAGCHVVESASQLAGFVARTDIDALRQIAGGNGLPRRVSGGRGARSASD